MSLIWWGFNTKWGLDRGAKGGDRGQRAHGTGGNAVVTRGQDAVYETAQLVCVTLLLLSGNGRGCDFWHDHRWFCNVDVDA